MASTCTIQLLNHVDVCGRTMTGREINNSFLSINSHDVECMLDEGWLFWCHRLGYPIQNPQDRFHDDSHAPDGCGTVVSNTHTLNPDRDSASSVIPHLEYLKVRQRRGLKHETEARLEPFLMHLNDSLGFIPHPLRRDK